MDIEQSRWTPASGWEPRPPGRLRDAQLALVFGGPGILKDPSLREAAAAAYPDALLFGCSTAGDIFGTQVSDDSLVLTSLRFDRTRIQGRSTRISGPEDSLAAGERLARSLEGEGLVHVLVLSDGLHVNGSKLVEGLARTLPPHVTVTGGLSGDGARFQETLVLAGAGPEPCAIAAVGFYGRNLRVGYGSLGGWDPFGPERLITRSAGNVLYELDGRSALDLYKTYLGPHARELPASGLLFPLSLRTGEGDTPVVRTILSVDEQEQSMTFAGDVPTGAYARFMKANFDRLIDGAVGAARTSYEAVGSTSPDLALLISCVGRKLVLKQRVEEEVEGRARGAGRPHGARRLLLLRRDLAVHAGRPLRAAQPDHDHHHSDRTLTGVMTRWLSATACSPARSASSWGTTRVFQSGARRSWKRSTKPTGSPITTGRCWSAPWTSALRSCSRPTPPSASRSRSSRPRRRSARTCRSWARSGTWWAASRTRSAIRCSPSPPPWTHCWRTSRTLPSTGPCGGPFKGSRSPRPG